MTDAATIIFCDIVGYSKTDDELQARLIGQLSAEVIHELYPRVSQPDPDPSAIFLPTGDGMLIVLRGRIEDRSLKVEVFRLLDKLMNFGLQIQGDSGKGLRIGVHSGEVVLLRDINRQLNVCGFDVNYCQRVMDAARPNQVLLSEHAYHVLVGDHKTYVGEPFSKADPAKFSEVVNIPAKHGLIVSVRVMHRAGSNGWDGTDPFPPGMIAGKRERTEFIVERLGKLLKQPKRKLLIYEQSAFGTFGFPENRRGWDVNQLEHSDLLREQKRLLIELTKRRGTTLYLMFRPVRVYDAAWRAARMKALIDCLKEPSLQGNLRFVVTDNYEGPNRLIVEGLFSIEGYKIHDTSGYELSFVKTGAHEIQDAITSFHRVFDRHRQHSSHEVLTQLKELHKIFNNHS